MRHSLNDRLTELNGLKPRDTSRGVATVDNTVVKYGKSIDIHEADAMQFVAANTSIPVPNVIDKWMEDGVTYITMTHVDGVDLDLIWPNLSDEAKDFVVAQLRQHVTELRATSSPYGEGVICSANGGYLRDNGRLGASRFGPFNTIDAFHNHLSSSPFWLQSTHPTASSPCIAAVMPLSSHTEI
ncbi:hypothetical protein BXZ70DRAFT_386397 [Cristinia sonorae]|uniref:Aminoglycoside phosphotransferase domain-containing protein n=1 Tax=Cristinia sonorae TaxID=1940300 RepID=A0A8K0XMB5_9AGAR|nr:hypothetical protein BXZ70DRAFT_386397 [Cristinia sonorae]